MVGTFRMVLWAHRVFSRFAREAAETHPVTWPVDDSNSTQTAYWLGGGITPPHVPGARANVNSRNSQTIGLARMKNRLRSLRGLLLLAGILPAAAVALPGGIEDVVLGRDLSRQLMMQIR